MYLYDTYIVGHREINPETVQDWMTHNLTKIELVMHVLQQFKRVHAIVKVTVKGIYLNLKRSSDQNE